MPRVITTIEYEKGDIYSMPREAQKALMLRHISERDIQNAQKDLFPWAMLQEITDRRIINQEDLFNLLR